MKKCTGCSSARYGKDQIQIECFKVCGLQTFTYFFGISMKLTFLMQAPCLNRKYRKNCEYCPGHSLIVQSLTLYVRKMGRLQLETQNFILIILESSDETRFCVSHEGIPIGLGRLYLTGIALAIKIPSKKEEAPHCKKFSLIKFTVYTSTL